MVLKMIIPELVFKYANLDIEEIHKVYANIVAIEQQNIYYKGNVYALLDIIKSMANV